MRRLAQTQSLSQPPQILGNIGATIWLAIPRGTAWDRSPRWSDAGTDSEQVGKERRAESQGYDSSMREAAMVG